MIYFVLVRKFICFHISIVFSILMRLMIVLADIIVLYVLIAEARFKRWCWHSFLVFTFKSFSSFYVCFRLTLISAIVFHSINIGVLLFFVIMYNYFLNNLFVLYWDRITFHIVTCRKARYNSGSHGSSLKCPVVLSSAWTMLVVTMLTILLSYFTSKIVSNLFFNNIP